MSEQLSGRAWQDKYWRYFSKHCTVAQRRRLEDLTAMHTSTLLSRAATATVACDLVVNAVRAATLQVMLEALYTGQAPFDQGWYARYKSEKDAEST